MLKKQITGLLLGGFALGAGTSALVLSSLATFASDSEERATSSVVPLRSFESVSGVQAVPSRRVIARDEVKRESTREEVVELESDTLSELARLVGVRAPKEQLFEADDPVEAVLEIEDHEKSALQKKWKELVELIKVEEVKYSESIANEDNSEVRITLNPVDNVRALARERFGREVLGTLGKNRGTAFMAFKGGESMFAGNETSIDYLVQAEDAGEGRWRFRISVDSGTEGEQKIWIADAIPSHLRHLTDAAGVLDRLYDAGGELDDE